MKLTNWIYEDNLRPFLTALSWLVGYEFDSDDWVAFEFGTKDTDSEKDRWFIYTFSGREKAEIQIASDPGSSVVFINIIVPEKTAPKVEAAIEIMQYFELSKGS